MIFIINEFLTQLQGAAIIAARKLSSAASAANATCDHMHDWFNGTVTGEYVSMAVVSDGSYGIPKGIVFSFPVTCKAGEYKIQQGLKVSLVQLCLTFFDNIYLKNGFSFINGRGVFLSKLIQFHFQSKVWSMGFSNICFIRFQYDEFIQKKIDVTTQELLDEKDMALQAVKD